MDCLREILALSAQPVIIRRQKQRRNAMYVQRVNIRALKQLHARTAQRASIASS